MQEISFTLPAKTIAAILLLSEDIGFMLEEGITEDSIEELQESHDTLASLIETFETGRNERMC